ncbi:MAG TPA: FAD-dependent oxidoreductase [Verrucomicrobiae bacterium]|jgi:glycine/D-amino acid oxidase-like deaminating enzyme|nr:FAD-dependent oxidoreductase [Verrucomicrobiae bacterium]
MELTSDYPLWSIINGLPKSYPTLDRDLVCDVAVVGGGITGALVGYYLAAAGVHAVLLDKRDIGTGSTSGSTGLLQYEVDVPLRELVKKIGAKKAKRSYELCGQSVSKLRGLVEKLKINCGHEQKTSLFLARNIGEISELKEEFKLRRQLGFDLEFWPRAEIEKHFPFSRPAALYSRLAGEVDPHRLTHGLLSAGAKCGLNTFDRSPVVKFEPDRQSIRLTTNRGFIVKARRAVLACGFESMKYVRGEAGSLKSTYALVSEPLKKIPRWHERSLIWETGTPYLYLRTTPDNRIIVGGEDVNFTNSLLRDALIPRKTATLVQKFNALFPAIPLDVAYSWAGTFGGTKDGLAYIGTNPGLAHTYFALGYGGNGITYSLIAAEIIRDDFLGRRNPDAHLFKFGR